MRIGHGFDAHRFCEGNQVVIGGVRIPHTHGMAAHSDGDVLIHAICDALLGALALGDIGRHFPDTDPAFEGIDSTLLLAEVMRQVAAQGYQLGNLDATVIAQAPRLSPHIDAMRARLAELMGATVGQVNVKATTTEKMGFTGRGEGISAHAVVLLRSSRG
ncbi:MAG: 2-C-methyl-D-erythritol 2,4-cyclodiphosphate synthase [Gammaproteobacteria bacterium]|nr:MAG: 2-C-methyl-D-erythritol 2,4-cyclodiphosphate synthase [Gammaproteobacteria bacterium]